MFPKLTIESNVCCAASDLYEAVLTRSSDLVERVVGFVNSSPWPKVYGCLIELFDANLELSRPRLAWTRIDWHVGATHRLGFESAVRCWNLLCEQGVLRLQSDVKVADGMSIPMYRLLMSDTDIPSPFESLWRHPTTVAAVELLAQKWSPASLYWCGRVSCCRKLLRCQVAGPTLMLRWREYRYQSAFVLTSVVGLSRVGMDVVQLIVGYLVFGLQ